jgi:NAD(P)-dependent dehydrogenase (short-subunit alcohol dehydrogenase family)
MQIEDKVVVVTGGASGIGKALCERFAIEGAGAVIVSDIDQSGIDATIKDISSKTTAVGIICDVAKEEEIENLANNTLEQFGHIDLFCSNISAVCRGVYV